MVALALARGHRAGDHLDARRARGHAGRRDRPGAHGAGDAASHDGPGRRRRDRVPGGRGERRAGVRASHRSLRTQAAVPGHARRLPGGHAGVGAGLELRVVRVLSLRDRRRHRRRVQRGQLRRRRADPGAAARARRPGGQQHLLAGDGAGRGAGAGAARHAGPAARARLARRVRRRRGARAVGAARCAATCRRARAGCCCTAATTRRRRSPPRSSPTSPQSWRAAAARCRRPARRRRCRPRGASPSRAIARVLLVDHRRRTILGLSLMVAQAFAYNGVFFTYALVLVALLRRAVGAHRSLPDPVRARQPARARGSWAGSSIASGGGR